MTLSFKRLLPLLAAFLALAGAVPAFALAAEGDGSSPNRAIAVNETDGSSVFEFAFAVETVVGDTVEQENGALAYSSCDACQTVAVAIQIVLVSSADTSTIAPLNEAIAINDQCTTCTTLAVAYQFVFGNGGPVEFTKKGENQLQRVRKVLERLQERFEREKLTVDEVKAALEGVRTDIQDILASELVPVEDDDATESEEGPVEDGTPAPGEAPDDKPTSAEEESGQDSDADPTAEEPEPPAETSPEQEPTDEEPADEDPPESSGSDESKAPTQ